MEREREKERAIERERREKAGGKRAVERERGKSSRERGGRDN